MTPGDADDLFTDISAVIIRALASMLQHVGLIKPEEMITERAFRRRFTDQLQRYSLLTSVGSIVYLVSLRLFLRLNPQLYLRFYQSC